MLLYLPGTDCLAQNVTPDAGSGTTVLQTVPSGTGVPADVVDPLWPLPMAPADAVVYPCSTDGSATTTTVAVSTSVQVDETLPPGTDAPGTTASGDSTTTALPGPGRGRARRG
ncbi:unannotated protein [freshwater metagenome]